MAHDDPFLEPSRLVPHEKREETGHPGRLCQCGCGQRLSLLKKRMFETWGEEQQDEGFGEPELKE